MEKAECSARNERLFEKASQVCLNPEGLDDWDARWSQMTARRPAFSSVLIRLLLLSSWRICLLFLRSPASSSLLGLALVALLRHQEGKAGQQLAAKQQSICARPVMPSARSACRKRWSGFAPRLGQKPDRRRRHRRQQPRSATQRELRSLGDHFPSRI